MEGIAVAPSSPLGQSLRRATLPATLDVTVLLPAFNEEQAIEHVLAEVVTALAGEPLKFEILVVDDGSTDRTVAYAERFASRCTRCEVRVLRRRENGGAGAARKDGV